MQIVLIILVIVVVGLLFILKKENTIIKEEKHKRAEIEKEYIKKLEVKEDEVSAHIKTIEDYQFGSDEIKKGHKQLEEKYIQLKEVVNKHKTFSVNIGEVMASRDLVYIFESYKDKGIISNYRIIDNILFNDDEVRQIDHLVVCDYGIYMIETKTWKGDVFYNANKTSLDNTEYKFLARYMKKEYNTFVIKAGENNNFQVVYYGSPYTQVKQSIYKIYNYFDKKYFVNGLVYFNYKPKNEEFIFFDGSSKDNPIKAVNQMDELISYFDSKIKNGNKCIKSEEIIEVASKLENYIIV
ncbi:nuclease-related domain-containing protein [Macrococcus armenti]|uniref:nuclease-related domain-containing protein n=1 Tax=Macrococcus armenti TaxID=2875764 RepID=UPI001CCF0F70|nr:nuclease-related domain-containing protein [Macrococcus armenti]UBH16587.1 NERD domain-containing protein [Macrococcus armenti]UBH21222.1 NERD domain-containing protein [Macrococcus armenti]